VYSQGAASAFCENLEISASLSRFYDAEGVLLFGHGQILRVVTSKLQKYS
jgi:hypothetical protein